MYVLQAEPEGGKRWRVLFTGGLVSGSLFAGTLAWAAQVTPKPRVQHTQVIQMRVLRTPELAPPQLVAAEPEKPQPEKPQPEKLPPKNTPRREPQPALQPPAPTDAVVETEPVPLALGITLSSTTQGGKGPRFATGDSLMGEPDRIAQTPRPPRKLSNQATARRAPLATVSAQPKAKSSVSIAAKLQRSVTPAYPAMAKSQGLEGVVVLAITIGPDGRVEDAQVLKGLGLGLDESALRAARQTFWSPATVNGQPIRSTRRFNVRFTLQS